MKEFWWRISFFILFYVVRSLGICPAPCFCFENSVDCTNGSLKNFPFNIPENTKILNLSHNEFFPLQPCFSFDQIFNTVETLDLSNNKLWTNNENSCLSVSFPSLKYLHLESCRLTSEWLSFLNSTNLLHLNLKSNIIQSLKENFFGYANNLSFLDLSFNNLSAFPSNAFSCNSSSALKVLLINNNEVEFLPINCFVNLSSLQNLSLSRNRIRRFSKDVFSNLHNLEHLDLNGNRLKRIPGLSFKGLQNLHTLHLERNSLTSLSDGAFWDVARLTDLYLSHNKLTSIERGWLYGLDNLRKLHVHHNFLTHIDSSGWQFCSKLLHLDLSRNHLKALRPKSFFQLSNLKELILARNEISQVYENAFLSLTNLRTLDLSFNSLANVLVSGQAVFKELKNLKVLKLNGNGLVILPAGSFQDLTQLVRLELADNPLVVIFKSVVLESPSFFTLVIKTDSLQCDCQANWLVEALVKNSSSLSLMGHIKCHHPSELNGRSLIGLDANLTCADEQSLRFEIQPHNSTVLRGSDFSFECRVKCTDCGTMFVWRKDGQLLYSDSENRYRIVGNRINDHVWRSVLFLDSVDETDSGLYICQVTSRVATILSDRAILNVHVPPVFLKKPSDVVVPTGGTARLECSAYGSPTPMLSWKKDGGDSFPAATERRMHVMPTDDVFFIVNAKAVDTGMYTCFARSSAGTAKAEARLFVSDVSTPATASLRTVGVGETAILECNTDSSKHNSSYKIVWHHNGHILRSDSRRHLAVDGKVLVILQSREEDQGFYTCRSDDYIQSARLAIIDNFENIAKTDRKPSDVVKPVEPSPAAVFDPTSTAGIVVIVVITCIVLTSLAWVLFIWRSRRSTAVVLAVRHRSSTAFEAVANVRV